MSAEPDPLQELSERIDRAITALGALRADAPYGTSERARLDAKIEGVALAGAYLDELLRSLPAPVPTPGPRELTEQLIAARAARVQHLYDAYVDRGGEPELLPHTLTDAERSGYLLGLATAVRLFTAASPDPIIEELPHP